MIAVEKAVKKYTKNNREFIALDDVSLKVNRGDYLSVTGKSGSGKSTLLYVIGGLIKPDSGRLLYDGEKIYDYSRRERDLYRKTRIGFVFQQFHLMPYLTVIENIRLSCYEKGHFEKIGFYLDKCSIEDLKDKYPSQLSVGEKQRTAFVRAIVSNPEVLLADEPTGNLDPQNTDIIMGLINEYHKSGGTVIVISHSPEIVKYTDKIITLDKGKIISLKHSS